MAEQTLTGKVAVVTGAGQGIGEGIAEAMAKAGASVVVAELDAERGAAVARRVGGLAVPTDVTDVASVEAMTSAVLDHHGRVDILVNNAGVVRQVPTVETTDEDWRRVLSVNLDGAYWCARAIGRHMVAAGSGSIVNIASMSGSIVNRPQPQVAYNVSKAGLIMLTKSLAVEWAKLGVRVNTVSPGYIATPLSFEGIDPNWRRSWLADTPVGRLGEVAEVASVVCFLASDASAFTTGANYAVDGGYTCW